MKVSKERVAEHRTRIMVAAARLFRQRGFDDVTVADVMKEAGLTHGAFYGHFPSKEALIAEAVGTRAPVSRQQPGPAPAGGGLRRRLSQRPAPQQSCDELPVLEPRDGGGARLSRSSAQHDAGHSLPDRLSGGRCRWRHPSCQTSCSDCSLGVDGRRDGAGSHCRR